MNRRDDIRGAEAKPHAPFEALLALLDGRLPGAWTTTVAAPGLSMLTIRDTEHDDLVALVTWGTDTGFRVGIAGDEDSYSVDLLAAADLVVAVWSADQERRARTLPDEVAAFVSELVSQIPGVVVRVHPPRDGETWLVQARRPDVIDPRRAWAAWRAGAAWDVSSTCLGRWAPELSVAGAVGLMLLRLR